MTLACNMRVLRPAPNVLAFYDGRDVALPDQPTWFDWGLALGTCSYAIVSGAEALVYDTQCSVDHGAAIRAALAAEGAERIRVVLSHHHTDHIAGNGAFADCEILANTATARAMRVGRKDLETGTPPVCPLVMPTRTFEADLDLRVGNVAVQLRSFNIHSHDGLVLWLPDSQTLLAGDTLEDPVTFVSEPDALEAHLHELRRLAQRPIRRILPNHGAPDRIARGGYDPTLLDATERYIARLLRCQHNPDLAGLGLGAFLDDDATSGALIYHPAYEAVHRGNVDAVLTRAAPLTREKRHAP